MAKCKEAIAMHGDSGSSGNEVARLWSRAAGVDWHTGHNNALIVIVVALLPDPDSSTIMSRLCVRELERAALLRLSLTTRRKNSSHAPSRRGASL